MPAIEPADLIADLRAKALRARLHAIHMVDQETADKLNAYAEELEAQVVKLTIMPALEPARLIYR
jgi:hypothetical protein